MIIGGRVHQARARHLRKLMRYTQQAVLRTTENRTLAEGELKYVAQPDDVRRSAGFYVGDTHVPLRKTLPIIMTIQRPIEITIQAPQRPLW